MRSKSAIIGDRVYRDVIQGNVLGSLTVLVKPIDHTKEHQIKKVFRYFENLTHRMTKLFTRNDKNPFTDINGKKWEPKELSQILLKDSSAEL